ncbi:MAG: hypothetical protein NTV06_05015 [candidate division Zixibacteria bacterium]|nr:hypothetical protein [candidate division Zixibacteria bacterium]
MLKKLGQLFIIGLDGVSPSDEFLEFCSTENIGGVILFEENCEPHSLAEKSIKKIMAVTGAIPFIGVDQEGGRVCRFRGAPAEILAPSEYGLRNDTEEFAEHFTRSAYYLYSLGINLIFGPVTDLALNNNNKCLEGRTFGKNPAKVIPFIDKAIRISNKIGLLSCLKHFPGFGAATVDPHQQVATADYDYQTFINREALTFKAGISAGADMVMTTHLILTSIDDQPATVSEKIVKKLLRNTLGFDGIVITDDLFMKGADNLGDYGERALQAFNAGHDMLLFGRDFMAVKNVIEYFKEAYRKGHIDNSRLEASLDRISGVKSKLTVPAT